MGRENARITPEIAPWIPAGDAARPAGRGRHVSIVLPSYNKEGNVDEL